MFIKKFFINSLKLAFILFVLLLILSFGLYLRTKGEYSVLKTVDNDPMLPQNVIEGIQFHCETFGDSTNPVVLVLHGGPGNDYRYLLPLSDLADSFFLVFYDQRGSGLSPRVSKDELHLDTAIADMMRFADHYSPEKPIHLIGHSWGAMLASAFTVRFPNRVDRVVLAEPGMLTSEQGEKFREAFTFKPNVAFVKAVVKTFFESLHIKEVDGQERGDYFFEKIAMIDMPENPLARYYCEGSASNGHLPFWRLSFQSSIEIQKRAVKNGKIEIDLISGIEEYPDTVLFITSSCNEIIGTEFQQGHMKLFPRLRHVEIENAGHTMFGEKPVECNAVIREYLSFVSDSED